MRATTLYFYLSRFLSSFFFEEEEEEAFDFEIRDLSFLSLSLNDDVNDVVDSFCFAISCINSRFLVNFAPRKHALTRCCFTHPTDDDGQPGRVQEDEDDDEKEERKKKKTCTFGTKPYNAN